jgi:hypothetical protein
MYCLMFIPSNTKKLRILLKEEFLILVLRYYLINKNNNIYLLNFLSNDFDSFNIISKFTSS